MLSDQGILSRRRTEELIKEGRITVNGRPAQPGHPIDIRRDIVAIDGERVWFQKKKKNYYYKPNNMISISNLVFRMKKNAVGLATIAILSSMVLVTLVGAASIYAGKKDYLASVAPHDYSVTGSNVDLTSTQKIMMIS